MHVLRRYAQARIARLGSPPLLLLTLNAAMVILLLLTGYRPAAAANIVYNPGFETGDFTGWAVTNDDDSDTFVAFTLGHTGSYAADFSNPDYDGTVAQTLTDVSGQNYTFSFWVETDGGTPSDFSALFNTTALLTESNPAGSGYTQFSYTVTGTGSDTITFGGLDVPGFVLLDDVSVTAVTSPTPEPSTIMLMGLVGCVGLIARRRRFNAPLRS